MKIDILCSDGSPLGVTSKTLWGDGYRIGLGGSEYALITMCEEWTKVGYEVVLYNDPFEFWASPFEQRPKNSFHPGDDRDVLIIFRSPNPQVAVSNGLKVWWSCDQQTQGSFAAFAGLVDKIVCISPYHQQYFQNIYGIHDTVCIDLPIRVDDFAQVNVERIPDRLVFTSVPARGLDNLWRVWDIIYKEFPSATLTITSDYRLWGVTASNEQFRVKWMARNGYFFVGAVPRLRYLEEIMKSSIILYPSNYDELFCISVAEAESAGCYPITSSIGALSTTNMGRVLDVSANDPHNDRLFADAVLSLLNHPDELDALRVETMNKSLVRFCPDTILKEWDKKVFI